MIGLLRSKSWINSNDGWLKREKQNRSPGGIKPPKESRIESHYQVKFQVIQRVRNSQQQLGNIPVFEDRVNLESFEFRVDQLTTKVDSKPFCLK